MVEIVAEIGKNFVISEKEEALGILTARAYDLIEAAKKAGCDTVKFQVHNFEDEVLPESSRYDWVKRNTYPVEFWWDVKESCRENKINFLATPMSRGAAILLDEIGVDRWKIGSGDILDFVMLDYIRDSGKPVILSSGMSSFEELKMSYEFLREKTKDISILHCVSLYPCSFELLNLNTIPFFKKQFPEAKIGFSDHSLSIEASLRAVPLGAEIIEKHFTLDRNSWGPDHKVSLLPKEMSMLVRRIKKGRLLESQSLDFMLGVETKYVQHEEEKFRPIFRKGLYATRDIREGEIIEPEMMYAMRPKFPNALSSEDYSKVLGKQVLKEMQKYDIISI